MTEPTFEGRIEKQIADMRDKSDAVFKELRALRAALEAPGVRRSSPNDVLTLKEAALYIGVSASTLRQGQAGTKSIPRYRDRPVQFLRSSLDKFKRDHVEREGARLHRPKRISLVRRKPRA